jgi:hypothetical protein
MDHRGEHERQQKPTALPWVGARRQSKTHRGAVGALENAIVMCEKGSNNQNKFVDSF